MPAEQPPVVRAATIVIVIGAVLTVIEAVSTLQNVGSTETVDALTRALSMGWGASSHLSVSALQTGLRIAANLSAVLAAAAGVLAVFAGRGSRQSRIGLSVLVLPILIACLMAGGYAGLGMLVGIALLWTRPARPWFAAQQAVALSAPAPDVRSATLSSGVPTAPAPSAAHLPAGRPPRVTSAGVVTIVLSALAAIGGLVGGIALASMRGRSDLRRSFLDRLQAEHITVSMADLDKYLTTAIVAAIVIGVLGLVGVFAGVMVLRGSAQARVVLIVLSAISAVISLVAISSIISLVWLVGSLSVIFGLGAADSAAWFKRR